MQYTQAQIDRANAVSLEDFLRTQGETLIKSIQRLQCQDFRQEDLHLRHFFRQIRKSGKKF